MITSESKRKLLMDAPLQPGPIRLPLFFQISLHIFGGLQFRMVLIAPGPSGLFQRSYKPLPFDLLSGGLGDEEASLPLAAYLIDLFEYLAGENKVRFDIHGDTLSVDLICAIIIRKVMALCQSIFST